VIALSMFLIWFAVPGISRRVNRLVHKDCPFPFSGLRLHWLYCTTNPCAGFSSMNLIFVLAFTYSSDFRYNNENAIGMNHENSPGQQKPRLVSHVR